MVMPTQPFGETGNQVSILGIGDAHIGNPSEDEGSRIVHGPIVAGVNFLDNAGVYNRRESKRWMGKALAQGGYGRQDESDPRQLDEEVPGPPLRTGAERDWPVETRGVMITGENPMIASARPAGEIVREAKDLLRERPRTLLG